MLVRAGPARRRGITPIDGDDDARLWRGSIQVFGKLSGGNDAQRAPVACGHPGNCKTEYLPSYSTAR